MERLRVQQLFDNGIPYMQFYGYKYSYESWGSEEFTNIYLLSVSTVYALSQINDIYILMDFFSGIFEPLSFF